ncbi:nitrogen metabolic regulation nmr [Fusarium albosuccineum]|uniref:Nitrogen metabolic regulation nmr n=1 Tax=Fusarium albosuccineum TaxID=1237068 RepID=A0A8H4KSM5_9HYPO|nr:nitrogen metabolic regulation nmr [Fusarium albosuccineum]
MSKLVSVIGATGIQGGSVVRALLDDNTYSVRAITRNKTSTAAQKLAENGAEVIEANLNDVSSLERAFAGSYAIFAATNFFQSFPAMSADEAIKKETAQGINLADAAIATPALQHFIWSTLPNAGRISNGTSFVPHYAGKNKVDDYIKSKPELLSKTIFLWVSCYASNMLYPFFRPFPVATTEPEKFIQLLPTPSSTPMTLVGDARTNVGLFAHVILNQPEKSLPAKFILGSTDRMTTGELLSLWENIKGVEAEYVVADKKTYYRLWPGWAEAMQAAFVYWDLFQERDYSGEGEILTAEDLGVVGLVNTATALEQMKD